MAKRLLISNRLIFFLKQLTFTICASFHEILCIISKIKQMKNAEMLLFNNRDTFPFVCLCDVKQRNKLKQYNYRALFFFFFLQHKDQVTVRKRGVKVHIQSHICLNIQTHAAHAQQHRDHLGDHVRQTHPPPPPTKKLSLVNYSRVSPEPCVWRTYFQQCQHQIFTDKLALQKRPT